MKQNKDPSQEAAKLRRRAEAQAGTGNGTAPPSETEDDSQRLLHELQVHQLELEMQNAELRQARDEAEAALEKYTNLYDFAPVGYVTLDRDGIISAANLNASRLIGVERSRLIGQHFWSFVADKTRPAFTGFLEKVFAGSAKETCEIELLKEGVSTFYVQLEGVIDSSEESCRIALIDITASNQAQEALRLLRKTEETHRLAMEAEEALRLAREAAEMLRLTKESAEAAARAKSQFFANMSHELRTPMSGILGMLQLALEEDLTPVLRGYLETTISSARSLIRIINDILDMSKIEASKLTIEDKPFSPHECISEAVDIITPEVRRKGLEIVISVSEEVPETLLGDYARLRQVLINLIGNAVKFTDEGKVVVHITAGKTDSGGKREFTFTVTDTGIGIPDDKKDLLFQPFSQVDASYSRKFGGTGLGLALCKEIVELMGGTISFESKEGMGSSFTFTIPLGEAKSVNIPTAVEPLASESIPCDPKREKQHRLLLAEDDPTIRTILELMFKRSNYTLDVAEDGQEAVEMWERGEYDLVLMDIQMPRLNGFEATRSIREKEQKRGGHTPIVAMTAHAQKEDELRCLSAGMDAYISKPIDFKECLQMIGQTIREKSSGAC